MSGFLQLGNQKTLFIITSLLIMTVLIIRSGPIPQPQEYHNFADQDAWLGIPNAANVLSNVPFFVAGVFGIRVLVQGVNPKAFLERKHQSAYWVLFISTCFVAAGSSYYHLWPNMETLFFDRLPMTIAFMSIVTILITEKVNPMHGPKALLPLVSIGLFSVSWWLFTELHPEWIGDLRLYILVQATPVLLTPVIVWIYPDQYTHTGFMYTTTGLYIMAKLAEVLDYEVYRWTDEWISGHTLKHLIASIGPFLLGKMLQLRSPINSNL